MFGYDNNYLINFQTNKKERKERKKTKIKTILIKQGNKNRGHIIFT